MYRILAIDDTSFFLRVLEDILSEYYEVFTTVSGEIAFRYMEQLKPDLILLDLAMPKVDGWQTMRQLKMRPDCSDIPVIFITSQTDKAIEAECLKLGAYDFITKPVSKEVLLSRVKKALEVKSYSAPKSGCNLCRHWVSIGLTANSICPEKFSLRHTCPFFTTSFKTLLFFNRLAFWNGQLYFIF